MMLLLASLLAVLLGATLVTSGSLQDIEHVVIFMQENRSWDAVSFLDIHLTYQEGKLMDIIY